MPPPSVPPPAPAPAPIAPLGDLTFLPRTNQSVSSTFNDDATLASALYDGTYMGNSASSYGDKDFATQNDESHFMAVKADLSGSSDGKIHGAVIFNHKNPTAQSYLGAFKVYLGSTSTSLDVECGDEFTAAETNGFGPFVAKCPPSNQHPWVIVRPTDTTTRRIVVLGEIFVF